MTPRPKVARTGPAVDRSEPTAGQSESPTVAAPTWLEPTKRVVEPRPGLAATSPRIRPSFVALFFRQRQGISLGGQTDDRLSTDLSGRAPPTAESVMRLKAPSNTRIRQATATRQLAYEGHPGGPTRVLGIRRRFCGMPSNRIMREEATQTNKTEAPPSSLCHSSGGTCERAAAKPQDAHERPKREAQHRETSDNNERLRLTSSRTPKGR